MSRSGIVRANPHYVGVTRSQTKESRQDDHAHDPFSALLAVSLALAALFLVFAQGFRHLDEIHRQLCLYAGRKGRSSGFDVSSSMIEAEQLLTEIDGVYIHEVAGQPTAVVF